MNSIKIIIISLFLLSPLSSEARKVKFFWGNSQKISEVYKLPNKNYFQTEDGKHVNLGVIYKVFNLFAIPLLITEDPTFIYTVEGKDDIYYNIDADVVKSIAEEYNINDVESLKKVPFWDAWGGKSLFLVLILFFVVMPIASGLKTANDIIAKSTEEKKED